MRINQYRKFKRLAGALIFAVTMTGLAAPAARASFEDGVSAYAQQRYQQAASEFTVLAENGLAVAQSYLGVMYLLGQGVDKDAGTAAKWFARAAEQGNAGAAITLGALSYHGDGIAQDKVAAYAWFSIAAAYGRADATDYLARLTVELTVDQIHAGQARAEAIYGKHNGPAWKQTGDADAGIQGG